MLEPKLLMVMAMLEPTLLRVMVIFGTYISGDGGNDGTKLAEGDGK